MMGELTYYLCHLSDVSGLENPSLTLHFSITPDLIMEKLAETWEQ